MSNNDTPTNLRKVDISQVKTACRVGEFVKRNDGSPNLIRVEYDKVDPEVLRSDDPRVYIFTVDGLIVKIGGSECRGGIRATLSFYERARTGRPGTSRFIIHGLIARELDQGRRVEIYMIRSPRAQACVCGFFGCENQEVSPFKPMERKCLRDYLKLSGGLYPEWNFQERRAEYPEDLRQKHIRYHDERSRNRTSRNRTSRSRTS